jgi:hypothetical protein
MAQAANAAMILFLFMDNPFCIVCAARNLQRFFAAVVLVSRREHVRETSCAALTVLVFLRQHTISIAHMGNKVKEILNSIKIMERLDKIRCLWHNNK